jgi:hypothetical protein
MGSLSVVEVPAGRQTWKTCQDEKNRLQDENNTDVDKVAVFALIGPSEGRTSRDASLSQENRQLGAVVPKRDSGLWTI